MRLLLPFLALASLVYAAPTSDLSTRQSSLEQVTDNYLFSISISQFISYRNSKTGPKELIWDSNGCTASPDNPFGFNCTSLTRPVPPCQIHCEHNSHSIKLTLPSPPILPTPRLRLPELQSTEPFRIRQSADRQQFQKRHVQSVQDRAVQDCMRGDGECVL